MTCYSWQFASQSHGKDKFDEAGYVALPPCLWSDEDPSLDNSVWLPKNTPMISVKKNKNTHLGHFGILFARRPSILLPRRTVVHFQTFCLVCLCCLLVIVRPCPSLACACLCPQVFVANGYLGYLDFFRDLASVPVTRRNGFMADAWRELSC